VCARGHLSRAGNLSKAGCLFRAGCLLPSVNCWLSVEGWLSVTGWLFAQGWLWRTPQMTARVRFRSRPPSPLNTFIDGNLPALLPFGGWVGPAVVRGPARPLRCASTFPPTIRFYNFGRVHRGKKLYVCVCVWVCGFLFSLVFSGACRLCLFGGCRF